MLTILPIQTKKHEEFKPISFPRPVFTQKQDTFERVSKPITFEGSVGSLADVFLKPILEETDIVQKCKLMGIFQNYCHDVLKFRYKDAAGVYHEVKTEEAKSALGKLLFDRAHEIETHNQGLNYAIHFLHQDGEVSGQKYNEAFEQSFNAIVDTLKRYNLFLKNGLEKDVMKPEDVFKLSYGYASEYARGRNVSLAIEGTDILAQHQSGIFSPNERLFDYELYTVFANLMQNAAKYTQEGSTVNVKFAEQVVDGKKYLTVSVRDEGIGIPKAEQKNVLGGERASNAIASGIAGTGYGLRRIKRITECFNQYHKSVEINSPLHPENTEYPGTEITAFLRLKD